ncbi:MAG: hypothetical protein HYX68_17095 [Planctomycetes bacterium]|nr:hypothetical protein [Planctomycetota bacterium]
MMYRISFLTIVAAALVVLTGLSQGGAGGKAQEATVVKVGDSKITLTFKGSDQKHTHDVAKDAKITLDDKKAKLEELKEGFHANVTIDDKFVVTKIDAHSKKK